MIAQCLKPPFPFICLKKVNQLRNKLHTKKYNATISVSTILVTNVLFCDLNLFHTPSISALFHLRTMKVFLVLGLDIY